MKRKLMAMMAAVAACLAGMSFADGAEPVRGRVGGMYWTPTTQTPTFPFLALWQVNPLMTDGSSNGASTERLDPADVASMPADAFAKTGYVCNSGPTVSYEFEFSNLTPYADYLLEFYLSEPWKKNARSQKIQINGVNVKDSGGVNDLVVDPTELGGDAIYVAGKIAFTNVTAQADGTISFMFPSNKQRPVLNVATLAGTNMPTAVDSLSYDEDSRTLSWDAARDTLAYYVQGRAQGGAWTSLGALATNTPVCELTIPLSASDVKEFRVVSSNGLGSVIGSVLPLDARRRVLYALNLGETSDACGWFMPANEAVVTPYVQKTSSVAVTGLDEGYENLEGIYSTYAIQRESDQLSLSFSNLTANAEYDVRLHSFEPSSAATSETYARDAHILTNGVDAGLWAITASSGYAPGTAVWTNLSVRADANGVMTVGLSKNRQDSVLCAVEVFARDDEPMSADVPDMTLVPFAEGVRIVPETRHAQFTYEIQYKDSENGETSTLATDASALGVLDLSVPANATRWYRVRGGFNGQKSAWTAWRSASRSGRSLFASLRINFTVDYSNMTPEGWLSDAPFRVGPATATLVDASSFPAITQEAVVDQAPDTIYQTQVQIRNAETYQFAIPGFDPSQTYRMRLHLCESYHTISGKRYFDLAVNGACPNDFLGIDAFAIGGGQGVPGVLEHDVKPGPDGVLRLTVVKGGDNPVLRGVEFLAATETSFGAGRLAVMRDADDTAAGNEGETFVTERDMSAFTWTAQDVVDAGANPRVLAHAKFYVPADGAYSFSATPTGTFNLWIDGQPAQLGSVSLKCGIHDIYAEHLPSGSAAAELDWSAAAFPELLPFSSYLVRDDSRVSYPDGWHFIQIGTAQSPAFLRATSADGASWLMGASGNDMWGSNDHATFLYKAAGRKAFDCSCRVTGIGGPFLASSTRIGFAVRSSLSSRAADSFVLYFGVDGTFTGTMRAYGDATPDSSFSIGYLWNWTSDTHLREPPFRLRLTRELMGANDRYVLTYESDDGSWTRSATNDVPHVSNVYVGPCSISHSSAGTALVNYSFEDLEFTDTTPNGLIIFVR